MIKTSISVSSLTLLLASALTGCAADGGPEAVSQDSGQRAAIERIGARVTESAATVSALRADDVLPSGAARVGILWQQPWADFDHDPTGRDQEYTTKFVVQELTVTGTFPTSFSIELTQPPPEDFDTIYAMGSMVLLRDDASYNEVAELAPGDSGAGLLARLSQAGLDALGIVSMPPVYITYKPDDGETVIDMNHSEEPLAVGYHAGEFNGVMFNADNLWHDCIYAAQYDDEKVAACGTRPGDAEDAPADAYSLAPIAEGDVLSLEIGGPDDQIHSLLPAQ